MEADSEIGTRIGIGTTDSDVGARIGATESENLTRIETKDLVLQIDCEELRGKTKKLQNMKSGEEFVSYLETRKIRLSESITFCIGAMAGTSILSLNPFGMFPMAIIAGLCCWHGRIARGGLAKNLGLLTPIMVYSGIACAWSVLFFGGFAVGLGILGFESTASNGSLDGFEWFLRFLFFWMVAVWLAVLAVYVRFFMLCKQLKWTTMKLEGMVVTLADHASSKLRLISLSTALTELTATVAQGGISDKFESSLRTLITGRPIEAALGVHDFLTASDRYIHSGMARGVDAIVEEFMAAGTDEDRMCMQYVLHRTTGSEPTRFPNGVLDEGREAGLPFSYFVDHPIAKRAKLSDAHVLALRLCNRWPPMPC